MKIDIRALARSLIVWGIAVTPVFTVGEVAALLHGTVQSQLIAVTPVYIKILKDVLLVALIMLGIARIARSGKTSLLAMPFLILLLYTTAAALLASDSATLALAGLRWIMPIFVTFFIYDFVDEALLERVAHVLSLMLVAHFVLQIVELFFMSHWYGANMFGLAARVPGFFLIPITASFFAMIVLFFAHFYNPESVLRRAIYVVAPVSIFLTQSGTGLVVLVIVAALLMLGIRRVWLIWPIGVAAVVIMFPLMARLTNRPANYVAVSGGTRIDIFLDLFRHSELVPTTFGYVTNTAVALVATGAVGLRTEAIPTIVDSTYASVWGNLGVAGAIFFSLFIVSWAVAVICSRRLDLYVATVIFVLYGSTTQLFETYPLNLLLAVCTAYYLKEAYLPFWRGRQGGWARASNTFARAGARRSTGPSGRPAR